MIKGCFPIQKIELNSRQNNSTVYQRNFFFCSLSFTVSLSRNEVEKKEKEKKTFIEIRKEKGKNTKFFWFCSNRDVVCSMLIQFRLDVLI